MVNNTSKLEKSGYISNQPPPVSIEKPFSKTHAPVFGLMLDGNF